MVYQVLVPPLSQRFANVDFDHLMVKIVIGVVITLPYWGLIWIWSEYPKKDVHGVLFLSITQSVGVVSSHCLHYIISFTGPRRLLPRNKIPKRENGL